MNTEGIHGELEPGTIRSDDASLLAQDLSLLYHFFWAEYGPWKIPFSETAVRFVGSVGKRLPEQRQIMALGQPFMVLPARRGPPSWSSR